MTRNRLAEEIFKKLSEVLQVDYSLKKIYIEAIKMGLKRGGVKC